MLTRQIRLLGKKTFGYLVSTRGIQENSNVTTEPQFTPVQIDVPWGKIDGKLWGSPNKQPLLAVHGWMDNAGTFDLLAPLLKNSSILAIDLPGHGLSSWLPRGIPYNDIMSVQAMRMVVKQYGWDKVKLLGHSMGGILCYNYSCLYPEEVQFVISIDALAYMPSNVIKHTEKRAKAIDKLIQFEKKVTNNPPSYPEDVAIDKWIKATIFSSLDVPTAKVLMRRGAKRKDDGTYYYTRDFRLAIEGFNATYTDEEIKELTARITCPYLVIKATQTPIANTEKYWKNVIEILTEKSKDFRLVPLDGSHHIHMMKAELVANQLNPFLEKYNL